MRSAIFWVGIQSFGGFYERTIPKGEDSSIQNLGIPGRQLMLHSDTSKQLLVTVEPFIVGTTYATIADVSIGEVLQRLTTCSQQVSNDNPRAIQVRMISSQLRALIH